MIEAEKRLMQELKNSPYGRALRSYLADELQNIDTVNGIKTLEEAIGRQHAVELLTKLFNFLSRDDGKKGTDSLTKKQYE